ncbi:hypothetical protein L596_019979 [Steinernema carpocapsae]|uniref:Uncharacterized protein n=1 Tax=Steinernema carpocapsae TaxID=34508 RepID=A0A4U5MS57_STECR|nr:hypothetical protein L596_019979 [Steinernema carpocapsae]
MAPPPFRSQTHSHPFSFLIGVPLYSYKAPASPLSKPRIPIFDQLSNRCLLQAFFVLSSPVYPRTAFMFHDKTIRFLKCAWTSSPPTRRR